MKYIPGLNGLRACAVLFVVINHWTLPGNGDIAKYLNFLPDGRAGVNLFFVLSGFLISSILFFEKEKLSETHPPRKVIIRFYIRRFLRIFPVYYLTLFVILLFHVPGFSENLPYFLTYTTNFRIYHVGVWGFFGHAWSLAVEEQFYLFWPFIIIFLSRAQFRKLIFIFIAVGPLSSFIQTYFFRNSFPPYILTPECFDAFGMGALLAYYYTENNLGKIKKWTKIALPFAVLLFFYWRLAPDGGHIQYLRRFFESILAVGAILFCLSDRYTKIRDAVFENRVARQIGIISYGIYLFHYSLPYFYNQLKAVTGLSSSNTALDLLIMSLSLILLSLFSYYFFEKPILSLKGRYKY